MNLSETTNYNKIYSNTYWGNFEYCSDYDDVINYRNMFINDYNITSKKCSQTMKNIFFNTLQNMRNNANKKCDIDHIEYYSTNRNSSICIFSVYSDDTNTKNIMHYGFRVLEYPLYYKEQTTFILELWS